MLGAEGYFKRLAYSAAGCKPSKNRYLRKDRWYISAACLSLEMAMPLVHKQIMSSHSGLFFASSMSFISALAMANR